MKIPNKLSLFILATLSVPSIAIASSDAVPTFESHKSTELTKAKKNLVFPSSESIKMAKESMSLQERDKKLDLKISIAQKEAKLRKINEEQELKKTQKQLERSKLEIGQIAEENKILKEEIDVLNGEAEDLKNTINKLLAKINKMMKEDYEKNKSLDSIEDINSLEGFYLTSVFGVGNNKKVTILHNLTVFERRSGEIISGNVFVKEINFDNIVISNGKANKTIYVRSETISEDLHNSRL